MKTLLYCTDYSMNSIAAMRYAKGMAEDLAYRLVICHIFGYPVVTETMAIDDLPQLRKITLKANRTRLQEFNDTYFGNEWGKTTVQIAPVEALFVLDGIIATANDWNAEMIVVGTKGESVLKEALLGSTTKQLISKAPCPVLAIPPNTSYMKPKTIVYATDFEEEDVYAIKKVVEITERFNAKLKVVHISTKKEFSGETQIEWFRNSLQEKVTYKHLEFELLFSEDIFKRLQMYLTDVKADLVVMLERDKRGLFKKQFHRDLVKKMETRSKIPVMSFNEANYQMVVF